MKTHTLHITGPQAIRLMRAAREGSIVRAAPTNTNEIRPLPSRLDLLNDDDLAGIVSWLNVTRDRPLKVLVPAADKRRWSVGVSSVVCSNHLPQGSFLELLPGTGAGDSSAADVPVPDSPTGIELSDNAPIVLPRHTRVLIDAPPLTIVHAASDLKALARKGRIDQHVALLRLIEFIDECCGSYARNPQRPHAGACHFDELDAPGRFASTNDVRLFIGSVGGMTGIDMARRAVSFAEDFLASPMESYLHCAFTLPPRLGGLSMTKPLVNESLKLNERERRTIRHKQLRPDFQWTDYRSVVEYLGDKEHAGKPARVEDKNRMNDYASVDYKAFILMYDDVRNAESLNETALMLAREFEKRGLEHEIDRMRRRMREPGFRERQMRLIATLLPPVMR